MNDTSIPQAVSPTRAATPARWRAIWPITTDGAPRHSRALCAEAERDLPNVAARHGYDVVGVEKWARCPGRLIPGSGGAHEVIVAECWVVPAARPVDDPDEPHHLLVRPPRVDRVAQLLELADAGATWPEAERETGCKADSLRRALHRAGRQDVAAVISAATYGPPAPVPSHPELMSRTA